MENDSLNEEMKQLDLSIINNAPAHPAPLQVFVITDHAHSMPSSPCGPDAFLSRESAVRRVAELARELDADETPRERAERMWVYTNEKDVFMRVQKDIIKKHPFEQIECEGRYEFMYVIHTMALKP